MLMRDSLKLRALNDEIQALRIMLETAERRDSLETANRQEKLDSLRYENLSSDLDDLAHSLQKAMETESREAEDEATAEIQKEINIREQERTKRDQEIAAKIQELDDVQAELDKLQQNMEKGMDNKAMILIGLGSVAVVLLFVLIFVMGRRGTKQPPIPPWMYPPPPRKPRARKKPAKEKAKEEESKEEPKETPKEPALVEKSGAEEDIKSVPESSPEEQETAPPLPSDDDPDVIKSEIDDIRKSVVSMSVGQPERTTTIVKEWLEQPAPPEPEPESKEESGEDAEDAGDKKEEK